MKHYLDGHIGDLILWSFCVLALVAFTLTVMTGHSDQTLGNILMGALGALSGYMTKQISTRGQSTTNVDTATNMTVNPPKDEDKIA
jgi:hypothetical protein